MENDPLVLVDDTSPEIFYNGTQWSVDTSASNDTFGGTQHVYRADSATPGNLSFNFIGKGLEIFGTFDSALNKTSELDGSIYRSLDNTDGVPSGRRGVRIFDLGVLSGPHQVVVQPLSGQFIIDYLVYPPVAATVLDGKRLIFDDMNPTFNFSGSWTPMSNLNTSTLPFNNTLMSTTTQGSSFAFDFVGSSISVYGAFNAAAGLVSATFSIDGSNPAPLQLLNRSETVSDWTMYRSFFQQNFTDSSATSHILNVTVVNASEAQPFFLDYVLTTGNSFTALSARPFKKTGPELKSTGLKIGLICLGLFLFLIASVLFSKWRSRRRRAKGLAELSR